MRVSEERLGNLIDMSALNRSPLAERDRGAQPPLNAADVLLDLRDSRAQVAALRKALLRIADYEEEVAGLDGKLYGHATAIARDALDLPRTGAVLPEDRAALLASNPEGKP